MRLTITGPDIERLDQEAGGHRIQRIPPTERHGRTHSSTVTVAVLDPNGHAGAARYASRRPEDFAVSWFSGTGPGGQNRNKVQASARIVHLPTGLVRTAQTRSREASRRQAMQALLLDLDAAAAQRHGRQVNAHRQGQIGSGERGDKRRTYRFQDDRVVDHVTGKSARCADVMKGRFWLLWT